MGTLTTQITVAMVESATPQKAYVFRRSASRWKLFSHSAMLIAAEG
jgi:hypothetical protein